MSKVKYVMGILVGLALLSCSSPTEPEPEVGLFLYGKATSRWNEIEYEWERAVITVRCNTCEDAVARIYVREDGSYGAKLANPDRHSGHNVKAELYCPIKEKGYGVKTQMIWDSFPSTPVEWNPELK
jgi:hypothetical protein